MDLERHDFQVDDLVERIQAGDHRLVALQVPEGLKIKPWRSWMESRAGRVHDWSWPPTLATVLVI